MTNNASSIEKFVEDMEECRKIGDLMLMWRLKDALNEIKRLYSSSSSNGLYLNALYSTMTSLSSSMFPSYFNMTPTSTVLQAPFYHHKLGSLCQINEKILFLIKSFHLRSTSVSSSTESRETTMKCCSHDCSDDFFIEMVDKFEYHGFFALSDHLWNRKQIDGLSVRSVIDELVNDALPYVDELHQILNVVNIVPLCLRLDLKPEIIQLKTNYRNLKDYMQAKEWDKVIQLISNHPSTLMVPYFWNEKDEKSSPLELAFVNEAPYGIIELIVKCGGPNVVRGAYNIMHRVYPFHRACINQSLQVLQLLVESAGTDILCTVNQGMYSLRTPLQMAMNFKNDSSVIRYIIAKGGKKALNVNTKKGVYRPILCACMHKYECTVEIVQDLINVGGIDTIFSRGHFDYTPLHYALYSGEGLREDVVKLLVKMGGKKAVLAYSRNMSTPMHFACKHAPIHIVKLLIKTGGECAIHATSQLTIRSPMLNALLKGRFDVATLLIEASEFSMFKIGQEKVESLLGVFVEIEKRERRLSLKEYVTCINFILEHGAVDQIVQCLFQHFDYGIAFLRRPRPIISMIDKLGGDLAWEVVIPFLQRFMDNTNCLLHNIIRVLTAGTLYLTKTSAKENKSQSSKKQYPFYSKRNFRKEMKNEHLLIVQEIIRRLPISINRLDDDDRLPFHVACEKGLPYEILKPLIDAHPDSVWEVDGKTGLPFIALAAVGYDSFHLKCRCDVNDIFSLCREHSGALSS